MAYRDGVGIMMPLQVGDCGERGRAQRISILRGLAGVQRCTSPGRTTALSSDGRLRNVRRAVRRDSSTGLDACWAGWTYHWRDVDVKVDSARCPREAAVS